MMDDLTFITKTFDQCLLLLGKVTPCMKRVGLTLNIRKSKFLMKEIRYLENKARGIADFPCPKTVKRLRRFHGIYGWYQLNRSHVDRYASEKASVLLV